MKNLLTCNTPNNDNVSPNNWISSFIKIKKKKKTGSSYSSYPRIFPAAAAAAAAAVSGSAWPAIVKTEEEPLHPHHPPPVHFLGRQHHHLSSSFPRNFNQCKHFPFLQDSDQATLEPSICQPLLKTIPSTVSSSSTSNSKIFSNELTQVLDSDCALSLLSSPPQTTSINLGQIVPSADRVRPLLSYSWGLGLGRYSGSHQALDQASAGFSCSGVEDEHAGSGTVLVPEGCDDPPVMNCQGLFAVGGDGSSDGGSQALPFSW